MIYRHLLCSNDPICPLCSGDLICPDGRTAINTSILATCRQILCEARPILYGENTWQIRIFYDSDHGDVCADFMDTFYFWELKYPFDHRVNDLRRFYISIEVLYEGEDENEDENRFLEFRLVIRKVCKVLSDIPRLDYLNIQLEVTSRKNDGLPLGSVVLKHFGRMLRRVRKVDFTGASPVYADFLARRMTSSEPSNPLPKMYEALEPYAKPFDFCKDRLRWANEAVENDDIKDFNVLRNEILEGITNHMAKMAKMAGGLYEYDPQGEMDALEDPKTPEW